MAADVYGHLTVIQHLFGLNALHIDVADWPRYRDAADRWVAADPEGRAWVHG